MTHASSIRYAPNSERIMATYRDTEAAKDAAATVTAQGLGQVGPVSDVGGNKHAFGVAIRAGASVDALLDAFGQNGPAREAHATHMQRSVLFADTKAAISGLSNVFQHASSSTPDQFVANIASRSTGREPSGGIA